MRRLLITLLCAVGVIAPTHAQIGVGPAAAAARNDATTFGNQRLPIVSGTVSGGDPAATVPGYGGSSQPQTQYFQGGMGDIVTPGSSRANACSGQSDPECQAIQLLMNSRTTRPQFNIGPNDPLVATNRGRTQNPTSITGDLFSTYQTCRSVTTVTEPILENKVCEDFSKLVTNTCRIGMDVVVDADHLYKCMERLMSQYNASCTYGRVIQVSPNYIYQCQQSPKKLETLTCNRTLSVTCTAGGDGCQPSGVVPSSLHADMAVSFASVGGGTWKLVFGTIGDNYWNSGGTSHAQIFDRQLQLQIANRSQLTQFSLVNAQFDDYVVVKVNGTFVYAGPKPNSDRAEVVSFCTPTDYGESCYDQVKYNATQYGPPELNTSWNIPLNINLLPFLNDGANVIELRTVVGDLGEGNITMNTRAACPSSCTDSWSNGCAALEQRAQ